MRWSILMSLLLVLGAGVPLSSQQQNSSTSTLTVDASPYDVQGVGPTYSTAFTDSPLTTTILGLAYERYLIIAGPYGANWFHFVPQLTIDIALANTSRIVVDGFRPGATAFRTGADGQSHLNFVYRGEDWEGGAFGAAQAIVEDPTSPFGLRSSGAVIISVMPGFKAFDLGDSGYGDVMLADGFLFPFYGAVYDHVYISADGLVSFDVPAFLPPTLELFQAGPPAIAAHFTDLDPSLGSDDATISSRQYRIGTEWYLEIEYAFIPESANPMTIHSAVVTLQSSGLITLHWPLSNLPTNTDAVVGITPGNNIDFAGTSSDLSAYDDSFQSFGDFQSIFELFDGAGTAQLGPFDLNDRTLQFFPDTLLPLPLRYAIY